MNDSKHRFPRSEYDALVFDYDGTLVDTAAKKRVAWGSAAYDAWGAANRLWNAYFATLPDVFAGTPREDILRSVVQAAPALADGGSPLTVAAQERLLAHIGEYVEAIEIEPTEDVIQMLVSLPSDMPLYVVSGAPDAEVKAGLEKANLIDWFDGVEGLKAGRLCGTKADALMELCEREEYDPLRVLYVGDTSNDMVSAYIAGMIGVFYGPSSQAPSSVLSGLVEGTDYYTAEKWSHFRVCEQH